MIKLSTAIVMLTTKLYIGNIRAKSKIGKIIKLNKEAVAVEYCQNSTNQNIKRI